jgi:D-alanine-D-alanine ligase-like ATP-grasp enzyme
MQSGRIFYGRLWFKWNFLPMMMMMMMMMMMAAHDKYEYTTTVAMLMKLDLHWQYKQF